MRINCISRFKKSMATVMVVAMLAVETGSTQAAEPEDIVRKTTTDVLAAISEGSDPDRLQQVAENKVVPHFDFQRLTQLAAGRVWHQATPEQQKRMSAEFQRLLVRTYTKALTVSGARDAKVTVRAARPAGNSGETIVHTLVSQSGRRPLAIDYRMAGNDDWKVIDVIVENVSLVSNYRDWFASQAASNGVESVIQTLREKNQRPTL